MFWLLLLNWLLKRKKTMTHPFFNIGDEVYYANPIGEHSIKTIAKIYQNERKNEILFTDSTTGPPCFCHKILPHEKALKQFEVGDKIKIVAKCPRKDHGWILDWWHEMDRHIGKEVIVNRTHSKRGLNCEGWWFPAHMCTLVPQFQPGDKIHHKNYGNKIFTVEKTEILNGQTRIYTIDKEIFEAPNCMLADKLTPEQKEIMFDDDLGYVSPNETFVPLKRPEMFHLKALVLMFLNFVLFEPARTAAKPVKKFIQFAAFAGILYSGWTGGNAIAKSKVIQRIRNSLPTVQVKWDEDSAAATVEDELTTPKP